MRRKGILYLYVQASPRPLLGLSIMLTLSGLRGSYRAIINVVIMETNMDLSVIPLGPFEIQSMSLYALRTSLTSGACFRRFLAFGGGWRFGMREEEAIMATRSAR